jgi:peptide deformylase
MCYINFMAILSILQYPDLRLRRKSYSVGNVKAVKIQKTIEDMLETLRNSGGCAALAATQLDLKDPPNITVINRDGNEPLCLINLEILQMQDYVMLEEGCMSVYPHQDVTGKVKRARKIKAKALDREGNKLEFEAKGHFAHVLQHEYDHHQGIVYIDLLEGKELELLNQKIAKLTETKCP